MAIADSIADNCRAVMLIVGLSSLAIFVGSLPILCLAELIQSYVIRRKRSKTPIGGPIPLKDGRKPSVVDFLIIKVHETHPLKSHDHLDIKGRENIIGLDCPICSKDLGGLDKPSLTVTPQCFHIFHTACFSKKFRCRNTCPSCNRAVNTEDMKEVIIDSKSYTCKGKSGNGEAA